MKHIALCCLLVSATAHATPQIDRARAIFEAGRAEFDAEHYQSAYDKFRESYTIVPLPALLFNMAAALQALGRPGEAAEKLRSYVRIAADDPSRGELEVRIRSLEEAQRVIDLDRLKTEKPKLLELDAVEKRGRKRGLVIGLSVAGVVIVGVALGLGLGLGLPTQYPSSTLGTQRATP